MLSPCMRPSLNRATFVNGATKLVFKRENDAFVQVLGKGADAAPAVVDLLERLGVLSR